MLGSVEITLIGKVCQLHMRRELLLLDGVGNVLLGLLLLTAPLRVTAWLGLSARGSAFYASLFGAVLVGIGIALLLERRAEGGVTRGLGLTGALVINLCFGLALAGWLVFGTLDLLLRGSVVLWSLAAILVGLSGIELLSERSGPTG